MEIYARSEAPRLLLLHGFANSHRTWDLTVTKLQEHFELLLVDLPGHGGTNVPTSALTFAELCEQLAVTIRKGRGDPCFVAGYSMGGRVALHLALQYPVLVRGLALIGASPGIADPAERLARKQSDDELAADILENGMDWFVNYWQQLPIFESQIFLPPEIRRWIRDERMACNPQGLAYSLRHFGTGMQEHLLPQLRNLHCPTLLIAGGRDRKFVHSNGVIASCLTAPHQQIVVHNSGHATHIENPDATAEAICDFFKPYTAE